MSVRVQHYKRLWIFTFRLLLAAAMGLFVSAPLSAAAIAPTIIDSVVIKLRDGALPNGNAGLTQEAWTKLFAALQVPFAHTGFTRDGAYQLQLLSPLPIDAARAALNRARLLPQVLYASVAPTAPAVVSDTGIALKAAPARPPVSKLIVKFRDAATSEAAKRNEPLARTLLDRLSARGGRSVTHERAMSGGAYVVRLFQALPDDQARVLAALLASDPTIEYAEPDVRVQPQVVPNDPLFGSQWHYIGPPGGVNLPPAWDITTGSVSIVVAVIDTGNLPAHPDLVGRFVDGYDFMSDAQMANDTDGRDVNPSDPGDWITAAENAPGGPFEGCGTHDSSFHGTHVAGTIGAASNNGIGVAGINWVSKILPARVLGKCGGSLADVADAIRWSAGLHVPGVPDNTNPARVLNLSLGGSGSCDMTPQTAINDALTANAVVVVAAGNGNVDASQTSPANCLGVITVGATGSLGEHAWFSNFGALVEISAPGTAYSTLNTGLKTPASGNYSYDYKSGTSMATPHVSGIASLMLSRNPALTPSQVISKIQTTARAFPAGTGDDCTTARCGAGIIDAGAAVLAAGGVSISSTMLSSSLNPAMVGANVTFTATVTGFVPSGSVNFTADGSSSITGCGIATLSGSGNAKTATCSTSSLTLGTHVIIANYSGDGANAASSSTTLPQVINAPLPTYQVSGTITLGGGVLGGVSIAATGGVSCSVSGAGTGVYACTVPSGWTGTVTPSLSGYSFTPPSRSYSSVTADQITQDYAAAVNTATVWVEDAMPVGATALGTGESWNWVGSNPAPYSGTLAHQSGLVSGLHQHYFYNATTTLAVGVGDSLFAYVYLDPANPPSEVMLQWNDGSWDHRAFWGANSIAWGTLGTAGLRNMGALPPAGQWVRLEVPAALVGLEGRTLTGMAFTLYGGRATWDYAGKAAAAALPTYQVSGTITLGGGVLGGVSIAASGGVSCTSSDGAGHYACTVPQGWTGTVTPSLSGYSFTPPSRNYNSVAADQLAQDYAAVPLPTYQVSGTITLGGGVLGGVSIAATGGVSCSVSGAGTGVYACTVPSGWTGTVTPSLSGYSFTPPSRSYSSVTADQITQDYAAAVNTATVWVEDAMPVGATALGTGESWNWVGSNPAPYSGTLAHQSGLVSGLHQHYFYNATTTLAVGVGDSLFAYVYLDPANPPSEVMLQWNDGSWDHRAFWGANSIAWGTLGTAGLRNMGALPPAGQWVRLEVPAALVGLEGRTLTGMAFTLYGGRATWDYAGKAAAAALPTYQVSGTITLGGGVLGAVSIAASGGVSCTSSDGAGHYACTVPQGWTGTVTPSLSGYSFTPPSRNYNSVAADQLAQDYAAVPLPTYQVSGTITLGGGVLGGVSIAATGGVSCSVSGAGTGVYACTVPSGWTGTVTPSLSGYSFTPPSRSYSSVTADQITQDYAAAVNTATVWVEDAMPVGATALGTGESWNWVGSNPAPYSGTLAHQSGLVSGLHQHHFINASATLPVAVGDSLFAYVYLDPANPPSEVMLQWNDGSWDHRAFWGANSIAWGTLGTAGLRNMGALPPAGQWVRLEVPAALVGLEGRTLTGMAFTLYGGRATWDYAGK